MPSTTLFDKQDKDYKMSLLCNDSLKVSIEAASTYGWDRYTGIHGLRIGIDSFGESAPAEELYAHFGLTVESICSRIKQKLES
jgi:transketolase